MITEPDISQSIVLFYYPYNFSSSTAKYIVINGFSDSFRLLVAVAGCSWCQSWSFILLGTISQKREEVLKFKISFTF
jgi:hypothetical protein